VPANHHDKDQAREMITSLVDREKELAAQVEGARTDADAMVLDATARAQAILQAAEQEIEGRKKAFAEKISALTRQLRDEKLAEAGRQLEQLQQRGAANQAKAAGTVVKYVMPESD